MSMRRIVVMSIIGLALAFGVFYAFSWPSTVTATTGGNEVGFPTAAAGELLHTGAMTFKVGGNRDVQLVTVKLESPTPGLELVATHVGLRENLAVHSTTETGPQAYIDALPKAPGYVLRPGDEGAFVVTFRALDPGTFAFDGIVVTYQSGWLTRTVKLGPRVTVKVPGSSTTSSPAPA